MKNSTAIIFGSMMVVFLSVGTYGATDNKEGTSTHEKRGKKGHLMKSGELKAYRAKQRKTRREFMKKQMEDNKAFRETLKNKEPLEAVNAIIGNRKSQHSEIKSFMDGLYNDFVSYAKEVMAKKEVPAEKQSQFLAKLEEHRSEAVNKHQEMHNNLIAALEDLKNKEDLTKEDIKETMSKFRPYRKNRKDKGRRKSGDTEE